VIFPFRPRASANEMTEADMPLFTIEEVLEVTSARLLTRDSHRLRDNVRRLSTDSRDVGRGDLFIALKGERFDGHEFVEMALQQGAVGAVVESTYRLPASLQKEVTPSSRARARPRPPLVLGVQDPLLAYQQLATYHRSRFNIPVVAVTGSNGKTTTKEMVARVFEERWSVLKTEGNLNNRIGVPHTLLKLASGHKAAVIEMGVDQKGQTTRLAEIVRPTIGLITNIGPDHLEFFGTLEASAQAKGELLDLMQPDDAVVLNADDAFFDYLASRARCRVVSFGLSSKAQVRATDVAADERRGTTFRLALPGKSKPTPVVLNAYGIHNVSNALAAAAVGQICEMSGASIARGLSHFRPASMRSQVETRDGVRIINDCYNANPASMKAAIDLLADLGNGTRTIAVLGDMLELGPGSPVLHREVGAHLAEKSISFLIATGTLGKELAEGARAAGMGNDRVHHTADAGKAAHLLTSMVRRNDVVLVKASRGMRMERIVDALRGRPSAPRPSRETVTAAGKGRKR
jgi:UDP-N-acetylmuramoyl-tripeptide--D-alanyl-D-alanine ligase